MSNLKTMGIIFSLLTFFIVIVIGLGDTITPLCFSFFLAYLLFPVIVKLERKGIKRSLAVSGVFVIMSLLFVTFCLLIIPNLISDAKSFLGDLPKVSVIFFEKVDYILKTFGYELEINMEAARGFIEGHTASLSKGVINSFSFITNGLFLNVVGGFLFVLNAFLIPLFFFYVINDYEKISSGIKSFIPRRLLPILDVYLIKANLVLNGYIRGQILVASILSFLYGFGLLFLGVKFGFLIGLVTGLVSIIPYAGFCLGFSTAIIIAIANSSGFGVFIGIVLLFICIQMIEGFIITPKLVGNKVGLSSFSTMLALIIGGNLMGLAGMLLAIPVAAIAKSIIKELKGEYQSLEVFN